MREKDPEEIFRDLNIDMNIFNNNASAFSSGSNIKALLAWNDIEGRVTIGQLGYRCLSQHGRFRASGP